MNKQEFITHVQKINVNAELPTPGQYSLIEFVYNYHPCIDNVRGKKQVANLWCEFGIAIFNDMESRAIKAKELELKLSAARLRVTELVSEMESLRNGSSPLCY